ncbi:hypothetical protein ABXV03_14620 [Streptomyces harbinensis]|uniref:hypothetical protein n=1 Tax=Streptomyces harbinensis TaxID=1176198 RepID=UPI003391F48B
MSRVGRWVTCSCTFRTTLIALIAVTAPGRNPRHLTQLNADGREHHLAEAIRAIARAATQAVRNAGRT